MSNIQRPMNKDIDLRSDTASRPTVSMQRAMADAVVGDEQRGEDPSVNLLCERVADLLGQEAALFLPSGIMCNQIALAVHTTSPFQTFVRLPSSLLHGTDPHVSRVPSLERAQDSTGRFLSQRIPFRGDFKLHQPVWIRFTPGHCGRLRELIQRG